MNTLTLSMALMMGFTGSLHCAGMCGPIMWIMPFRAYGGLQKALAIGLYHLGRISMYATMAVVLHSFKSLFDPRIQQYISLSLGGILLIIGILSFIPNRFTTRSLPWAGYVQSQLGKVAGRPGLGMLTISGVLNGLLPCGLVYMALSASLSATSVLQAAGTMYFFGAGTLPMLLSITLLHSKMSFLRSARLRRFVPVIVFAFGCLFILRGMNLGIAYLSPSVTMEHATIKSACCHSN